ncbi:39S ribosomal protein L35, mitochondrial [Anoplophora glabripennis]|uniref:39S ribosomal protein L35, mitochondrial n=1 Tax=Anoplophora glabripennis TaxID=217634 RepID=UPI00087352DA|nr:39S ribosomal protein L35, mitochondrial [Anoplophora glabripennis]
MFGRVLIGAARIATAAVSNSRLLVQNVTNPSLIIANNTRCFSSLLSKNLPSSQLFLSKNSADVDNVTTRSVTKYSIKTGKRKSVKAVLRRFYRLHWGIWIRTKCGRHKKLWKKSPARKRRLRQHVFCNATQSTLLDKMVTHFWRKPKYYVDDPYEPYHTREEWQFTYTKPRPYFPPEEK